jgi:putative heme-binding domain-containing protein
MAADAGDRPVLGTGYFVRNPKYGTAVSDMLQSPPRIQRMHDAQMLLWLDDGWTLDQRRRYFTLIADAVANSRGGHQYREFWGRIRESALKQIPADQREEFKSIHEPEPSPAEGLPVAKGPGREWTLDQAMRLAEKGLAQRDLRNGREMYLAARCGVCHQFNGEGGAIGPDLSTLGKRFTVRDILDATIHPSRAISDQYQVMTFELEDGRYVSGRVLSRDETSTHIAIDLLRPTVATTVPNDAILRSRAEPLSTMPTGLLNTLNEDELLNLIAYMVHGAP